ncbi:MAG: 4-(cytidine 5'-diphospho)-2-C-methyl-D-erythritol kinase [Gammaproteobacteria bacterium]|nr:4-(cytidine 5'-diphospho)-2-C-methyl-D-erythritol kinase [Gammaproteobacteria bacterium]MBT4607085.1 4-(cytidine 5'-diphospho)-2-C-methyl-D-erythritol kinase [Thiotrichales bacterium]MBT3472401.1 4-(cytidine 5'-diphospho)-2-C-methyl-D-erythritol kinase [Gammaproteobacteria bacterium]MBT3968531.1 4-(cytidine 5'-diphospho)-2-C-methyl-D-erythritol kinase [Gammaproteobacteria bacterium]MBT4079049.1 4-(cytidine 5'-diphospho)-2-C-methyl-D-erythritol kinase [Gammaproteobacteria bacterium]
MNWPAPAKLNLFLHITGRREDGYHELQTIFQFIELVDQLTFVVREDGVITRPQGLAGVPEEQDLVVRAARLLQQQTETPWGAEIRVKKVIPAGGGLGGGSSDAATTLVALNQLWNTGLSEDALAALGVQLGADVPIFVRGLAAWAEGVGEKLTPVKPPEPWYLVVSPEVAVSTIEIFQSKELTRNTSKAKIRGFLPDGGRNDCESVVVARYPKVGKALQWLSQFGEARMTGTGSCLFVAMEDREAAEAVKEQLPTQWKGFVVKGVNKSPLMAQLKEYSGVV